MTTQPLHPDVIELLDHQSLLEAYRQTDGQLGNAFADELLAEIKRRNLDV